MLNSQGVQIIVIEITAENSSKLKILFILTTKSGGAQLHSPESHHQLNYALKFDLVTKAHADDAFVICRNARMHMCLCYKVDV